MIDTVNNQFVGAVVMPSAGNGVVGIPRQHEVWVGLNDSTVQVVSTDTLTITDQVSTGGTGRADEAAYDPADQLLLIANDRDSPPFVSFLSTTTYSVVKKSSLTVNRLTYPRAASNSLSGTAHSISSISPSRPPAPIRTARWTKSILRPSPSRAYSRLSAPAPQVTS